MPESELIREPDARVIRPVQLAVAVPRSAPPVPLPVAEIVEPTPLSVSGTAVVGVAASCSAAPLATITPDVPPSAPAALTVSAPPLICVAPV